MDEPEVIYQGTPSERQSGWCARCGQRSQHAIHAEPADGNRDLIAIEGDDPPASKPVTGSMAQGRGEAMSDFSPPPTDTVACMLLFQDGKAYAAPAGTSADALDPWRRVDSLDDLAGFLRVPFRKPDTGCADSIFRHAYEELNSGQWICKECGRELDKATEL